ncbi:unnamed protein product [Effrenium voratum]|uniref:Uncharacterized protein n=1 Tax=Effrenium voratum TaxID=2562239 RepID=A0AA36JD04_9DINO|nr:unnamed protein product [Effrenium voratum]CAJ1457679.1 unnamed protein product [Effrenium voratum]
MAGSLLAGQASPGQTLADSKAANRRAEKTAVANRRGGTPTQTGLQHCARLPMGILRGLGPWAIEPGAPLGRGSHAVSFYGDGINDLLAQKVEDLPDEPPEQPEAPQPPEIHLPTDGPIGEGYEVIMDVPPSRRDGFNGPAMQPYHVGMISHAPVLMGWSPLVWQAWLLTCPRASRNRHSRAFL